MDPKALLFTNLVQKLDEMQNDSNTYKKTKVDIVKYII